MSELLDPKMDYIFKTIFGTDDKKPLLISFLNALFKGKPYIKSVTLENTDIPKILKTSKASRLDIKATTDDGTKLDIEIQCNNTGEIPQRAFHYLANMMPKVVPSGKSYKGPNVIGIWILGENVTTRQNAISDAYVTFQPNPPDPYEIMTKSARIIFIELPKFNPKSADAKDLLTAWLAFLKDPVFIDSEFLQKNEIKEALDTLKYISADNEVRAIADLRQKTINDYNSEMTVAREKGLEEGFAIGEEKGKEEGIAIGKEEGIAIGKEEGIATGMKQAACSMLKEGLSVEVVSKCTGLSVEEVESLKDVIGYNE
ncbi:MAG: Rpn family recombination-promoting nuclease/putative transposase [Holosporales bacterium]|jgi:predicted transposase/invertase (TIGR01784 family)|nr:Rpn family recombination-promoting nuclease/putative transposase [Holosporales bacterium]